MNVCNHCHQKPVSRPRSLCWQCYYAPGVRDLYVVADGYNAEIKDFCGQGQEASPTDAWPGSEEKVEVLCMRAASGQRLWHQDDPTLFAERGRRGSPIENPKRLRLDTRRIVAQTMLRIVR